ncbi:MAG TPA: tetratricopeptide repeat protein [Bacteroidales bacterium]|nr:tetratricopeptide repeat protein [Bacteroidales bacterium]
MANTNSQSAANLLEKAWEKFNKKEYEEAIGLFDQLVEKDENQVEAIYGRACAYCRNEEFESALKDLNSLIKIDGRHFRAYHVRGLIKGAEEKYKDAIKDFEKVISLSKDNQEAWLDLGGAYLMLQDYTTASMAFEKAIDLDKACPHGWYGKGVVALYKKEYKKAIEFLNAAIKLYPKHLNAILARAEAYFESNQREEGMRDVKKAAAVRKDIFSTPDNDEGEAEQVDEYESENAEDISEDTDLEDLKIVD